MTNWNARIAGALAGTTAVAILGALPAAAHVTVNPGEAEKGGFAKLTFRVPNERDDASTTKLEVTFPQEHPLSSVTVKPHRGWAYEVGTVELDEPVDQGEEREPLAEAVQTITWTAAGENVAIAPGEFDEFDVSVGPLPDDADEIIFKAVQTYDSGEEVAWIEVAAPGAEELPERPAPALKLLDPAKDEQEAIALAAAETENSESAMPTVAIALSVAALLLGAGALVAGVRAAAAGK